MSTEQTLPQYPQDAARPQAAPPGWHKHSDGSQRYWDGYSWTLNEAPVAIPESPLSLLWMGYIMALLVPFVGFTFGIIAATRPSKATANHGVWIITLSVVALITWAAIIAAIANSNTGAYSL
jgi:hypothetical protein